MITNLYLIGGDDFLPAAAQYTGRLGCQMDQFFDTRSGFGNRKLFKQRAQLHDKSDFAGGKISPMQIDAIRARETSTSALISNAVINPITASRMMGMPHRMMAIHAISNGKGSHFSRLQMTATPEITRNVISFLMPPSSKKAPAFP